MEILTSKLQTIELNIINCKIQCLKKEISQTFRKLYSYQIEKSEKNLKKADFRINIKKSLLRLNKYTNYNTNISLHYIHRNIHFLLKILKNKILNDLSNNITFKLIILEKAIYCKKDTMYSNIRNTVIYKEKKDRVKRKIEIIFKELTEKIIVNSEKCINMNFSGLQKYSWQKFNTAKVCVHKILEKEDMPSFIEPSQQSIKEVNGFIPSKYEISTFDSKIREAVCTVNKIIKTSKHPLLFNEKRCSVNSFINILWNERVCLVNKNKSSATCNSGDCVFNINGHKDIKFINNICKVELLTKNKHENFLDAESTKIRQDTQRIAYLHEYICSTLSKLNKKIFKYMYTSLKDLYCDIIKLKILITLKELQYYIKGQTVCNKNQQNKRSDKNESKYHFIIQKGNLESDKRLLEMMKDTLCDIEKYKDPVIIRMGIQFILAKKYVEDIIYLKEK